MKYEFIGSERYNDFLIVESSADYRADADGAWKYALEIMFFEFLQLFVPDVYDLIDIKIKPESKETELKELLPNLKSKQRIVDKLVRVKYKNGKSAFLMIHIEVESKANTHKQQQRFAARMYDYYTMLSSKYKNQEIINIGVLINSRGLALSNTDAPDVVLQTINGSHEQNRHNDYLIHKQFHPGGQALLFKFPVVHLAKWLEREEELKLLAYSNPFAIIVLYQLIALRYKDNNKKLNAKVKIMRMALGYGHSRETARQLLYLIDWMITLPEDLQDEYYKEVKKMETETKERFVSIYEIMGKREGLAEGLEKGLEQGLEQGQTKGQVNMLLKLLSHKFQSVPDVIVHRIESASIEQIETWSLNLLNAQTIDEVFND